MLALIGALGIALFIFLMMRGKTLMPAAFIIVILFIPLAAGSTLQELSQYVLSGIESTASLGFMAAFAVLFFTLMNKAGVFDTIVGLITRRLNTQLYPVFLAALVISIASHLDGQAPSTILVTVSTMYPIFKKLKVRPGILALIISITVGIWNFLPWGAVNLTNSVVMGLDVIDIWNRLLPSMAIMTVLFAVFLFFLAKKEKARIEKGLNDDVAYRSVLGESAGELSDRAKKLLPVNIILTVVVLAVLFANIVSTALVFMAAFTIAIIINYRTLEEQNKHVSENAMSALMIFISMILGGMFGSVLSNSGVLTAMVNVIVSVFPASWSPFMLPIFGLLSFPLGWLMGLTAYHFGVVTVINGVVSQFGFTPLQTVSALAPGYSMSYMICPNMPSAIMLAGVMGLDLKEHIRFCMLPCFLFSVVWMVVNILLGIVPLFA